MLGASLLARTYSQTRNNSYRALAKKAMRYTSNHQRANGPPYYGKVANVHWVDNFHTANVLDCFKYFKEATGDEQFEEKLYTGFQFWKYNFCLGDGTPRYYDYKILPIDMQCSSQAIDTLVFSMIEIPRIFRWRSMWPIGRLKTCRTAPATSTIAGIRHGS